MRALSLVILLAACTGPDEGADSGTEPVGGDYDPYQGLAHDTACNEISGTAAAGATGYFVGDYDVSGGSVTGVEEWVLFSNPTWQDVSSATDCSLVWDISGAINEPSSCTGCTHEVAVSATFNGTTSDCVQGLEDIEGNDFQVTYYLQVGSDGSASWNLPSGTYIGDGVLNDVQAAFTSESSCNWF